jgi:uncharacterized protein involved in exopolysaccharide biosynthesis
MNAPEQRVEQAGEISLDALLAAARRDLWSVLGCVVLLTALTAAAAFIMVPKYRVQVVMLPVKADDTRGALAGMVGQLGGLAGLAGLSLGGGSNKDEYLEYLRSKAFTARFIEDQKMLPVLFDKYWDEDNARWDVDDPEDVPTLADGVRRFDRSVRAVQEDRRTGIITLSVVWKNRELAARWANLLVEQANRDLRQRAIEEADASLRYLDVELAKTNVVGLQQSIYRLIESEIRVKMLANVRESYAFKVIDPAVAPDADDWIRPKRAAMIAIGAFVGLLAGLVVVAWRLRRAQQQP